MNREKRAIYWKSKITGKKGHGDPLDSIVAQAWVTYGNARYPQIVHRTMQVSSEAKNDS